MSQNRTHLSALRDWVDFDVAMHAVGCELGLVPTHIQNVSSAKAVFWSNNPIGEALYRVLMQLVEVGYVLHDREQDRFKLNENFEFEKTAFGQTHRKGGAE